MHPTLSRNGMAILLAAALMVIVGALLATWPLVALGFVQLSAVLVLYVIFAPQAALLRRRQLEFGWWVPAGESVGGALIAGRKTSLHLLFRNHSPYRFSGAAMRVVRSSAIELERDEVELTIPPSCEVRLKLTATPRAAGYWFLQGVRLGVADRFGIFGLQIYFPNLLGIKVFPPLAVGRRIMPFRPRTGASEERAGPRVLRQRGLGTDLRELREHVPGDPFKRIAWKATARTRKLMVREFESEIVVTHWILLDISPSMRAGRLGRTKLDYALGLCAGLARQALTAGDRVGLITFDTRIYGQLPPKDGRPQLYRIIDRLMELHNIVDEDLTDLTDAELYSAVAHYLAYQEGTDVRVDRPAIQASTLWNTLVEGADEMTLDLEAMIGAVRRSLEKRRDFGTPHWWSRIIAGSPQAAQLRLFCRLRGVELPYRRPSPLHGKEVGMAAALARAGASRASQFILLVSDLEQIGELGAVLDGMRLARRHNHSLAVVAPFAPAFAEAGVDLNRRRIVAIDALRHQRQRREVRLEVERQGVPVLSASPADGVDRILAMMQRLRIHRVA